MKDNNEVSLKRSTDSGNTFGSEFQRAYKLCQI
jgi:hypothetical protein